jgi:hypothetical protein
MKLLVFAILVWLLLNLGFVVLMLWRAQRKGTL